MNYKVVELFCILFSKYFFRTECISSIRSISMQTCHISRARRPHRAGDHHMGGVSPESSDNSRKTRAFNFLAAPFVSSTISQEMTWLAPQTRIQIPAALERHKLNLQAQTALQTAGRQKPETNTYKSLMAKVWFVSFHQILQCMVRGIDALYTAAWSYLCIMKMWLFLSFFLFRATESQGTQLGGMTAGP